VPLWTTRSGYRCVVSESDRPIIATTIFEVVDLEPAAAFYRRIGLQVDLFSEEYAIVTEREGELLHLAATDDATPGSAYFNVANADAWHRRCLDAGGEPTPVKVRSWGMREFSIADPAGNTIRIGENV
jgi:predicted enzyme related to lactoylglutathione lyase